MTAPLPLTVPVNASELVGQFRRLGPRGPVYLVQRIRDVLPTGDVLYQVIVLETNEAVVIPGSIVLRHPEGT